METITITVDVDGSEVTRKYAFDIYELVDWGERVVDMLDTIKKSDEIKF
jgi:hypothetical protein